MANTANLETWLVVSSVLALALVLTSIASAADPGLVGWWRFDDGSGTTAIDSSGNGFDIPLHNTTWEDGVFGGASNFHGEGHGYVGNFRYGDNAITVCAWVRHDAFRISKIERYVTVAPEVAVIRKEANGSLHFYIKTDGSLRHLRVSGVFTEGRWHHVAGTWDGVTQRLYIDGVEIASQEPGGVLGNTSNVEMGSGSEPFNGMLDEVRIYNRALMKAEIKALLQREGFPFASNPTPLDGATLVDTEVTLNWTPGFGNPNYLKIDGRPVVFIYLTRVYFRKTPGYDALAALRVEFPDLYIIADDIRDH